MRIEQLEFQCPTTATAFWLMNLFATETACLGSACRRREHFDLFAENPALLIPFCYGQLNGVPEVDPILLWSPSWAGGRS